MIHVIGEAAARGRRGEGATLIEARTYRRGAHSSSDDPSVYRDPAEPKEWERHDPIERFRKYLIARARSRRGRGAAGARDHRGDHRRAPVRRAVAPKPPLHTMFEDVYSDMPWHLREQQAELDAEIAKHGNKTGH